MNENICSKCGEQLTGLWAENAYKFRNPLCGKCFYRHKAQFREQLKQLEINKNKNGV